MYHFISAHAVLRCQWLALVVGAWLLGACSSAPIEQSTSGRSTPAPVQLDTTATLPTESCSLLTPGEVARFIGQPVQQQAQGDACRFVESDQPGSANAVVTVSFRPAAAFIIAREGSSRRRYNLRHVTGLGREAYYDVIHGDLYVQLPARTLVIGMPRAARGYAREQVAPELGRLAVARLAAQANTVPAQ